MTDDIGTLLRDAAADPKHTPDFDELAARGRRQHLTARAGTALAVALALVVGSIVVWPGLLPPGVPVIGEGPTAPTGVEDAPDGWQRVEIGRAVFGVPGDWTLETFTEPAHVCQNYAERATVFVLHAGPPDGDHICTAIGMRATTLTVMPLSRVPATLLPDPGPEWTDLTTPAGVVGQRANLGESTTFYRFPGLDLWLQFDSPGPLGSLPDDILATMSEADSAVEPDATTSPNAAETEVASGRDQWRPRAISKVIATPTDSALTILSETCNAELRAEVILESPTSVEVALWTHGGTVDECGDGIKVSLTTPLGDRSVIDQATGNQVLVSPE